MLVLAVHFFCYADPGCAFFCFASLGCDFLFCIFVVMQILIVQGSSRQLWSVPLLLPVDLFFSTTFWSHCRWYDTLQPPGSSDFSSTCNSSLNNIQLQQPSQNIFAPPSPPSPSSSSSLEASAAISPASAAKPGRWEAAGQGQAWRAGALSKQCTAKQGGVPKAKIPRMWQGCYNTTTLLPSSPEHGNSLIHVEGFCIWSFLTWL